MPSVGRYSTRGGISGNENSETIAFSRSVMPDPLFAETLTGSCAGTRPGSTNESGPKGVLAPAVAAISALFQNRDDSFVGRDIFQNLIYVAVLVSLTCRGVQYPEPPRGPILRLLACGSARSSQPGPVSAPLYRQCPLIPLENLLYQRPLR